MKLLALGAVVYIHRRRERIARAAYADLARDVGAFYVEEIRA